VNEIVNGDIADIIQSDILLVNAIRPSWGTGMEVFFAANNSDRDRLIVTVCPLDQPSPRLLKHSTTIKKTFEKAFEYLLD
jgi:hypothetical protein